jgi:hypothetical protein
MMTTERWAARFARSARRITDMNPVTARPVRGRFARGALVVAAMVAVALVPRPAAAHCDSIDGPVVAAARVALAKGDARRVLHWVSAEDERAVEEALRHATAVRRLGPEARALADRFFFETVVRLHRAGEGAPYTGLKSGAPERIVAATDAALERGDLSALEAHLVSAVRAGLRARFAEARQAQRFEAGDVAGGRAFVTAYVSLTHWVEGVALAAGAHPGHESPTAPAPHHAH